MPEIEITTLHPSSSYGVPVCLLDGDPVDDKDGLIACLEELKWSRNELVKRTGKSRSSIDHYCLGLKPVPAEVWNVLIDAFEED